MTTATLAETSRNIHFCTRANPENRSIPLILFVGTCAFACSASLVKSYTFGAVFRVCYFFVEESYFDCTVGINEVAKFTAPSLTLVSSLMAADCTVENRFCTVTSVGLTDVTKIPCH